MGEIDVSHDRRDRRRAGGARALPLLVLLVALCAAGGWNYHRNLQAERADQGQRVFAGYGDRDLEQLAEAYRQEIEVARRRYEASRRARPEVQERALVGDGVREFERIQRHSQRSRERTADLAEREARLEEIERELAYRAELRSGVSLHIARLTRI